MKKRFKIATVMVAILLLLASMVPPVMSGDENTTNVSKTNEDSIAGWIYPGAGSRIIGTINKTNVSELELPISIAAISDLVGKIAFVSDIDGDNEIYVMDANGANVVQLTRNTAGEMYPFWSPDCKKLVFCSDRDGDDEIFVMDVDGTNVTQLPEQN